MAKQRTGSRWGIPLPAVVAGVALAAFGAVTATQWVLTSLLGIVKLVLLIVVVFAAAAWVISAKANR